MKTTTIHQIPVAVRAVARARAKRIIGDTLELDDRDYYRLRASDVTPPRFGYRAWLPGDRLADLLHRFHIRRRPGCGCPRRQAKLNRWWRWITR